MSAPSYLEALTGKTGSTEVKSGAPTQPFKKNMKKPSSRPKRKPDQERSSRNKRPQNDRSTPDRKKKPSPVSAPASPVKAEVPAAKSSPSITSIRAAPVGKLSFAAAVSTGSNPNPVAPSSSVPNTSKSAKVVTVPERTETQLTNASENPMSQTLADSLQKNLQLTTDPSHNPAQIPGSAPKKSGFISGSNIPVSSVSASAELPDFLSEFPSSDDLIGVVVEFKAALQREYKAKTKFGLMPGDHVIVEADRGTDIGRVVSLFVIPPTTKKSARAYPKVIRPALRRETVQLFQQINDEYAALLICCRLVEKKSLPMKVHEAQFQFDRRKLTFFFTSEQRVDFRGLVKDLFKIFKARIWMKQVSEWPPKNFPFDQKQSNGSKPQSDSPESKLRKQARRSGKKGSRSKSEENNENDGQGDDKNDSLTTDSSSSDTSDISDTSDTSDVPIAMGSISDAELFKTKEIVSN